MKNSNWLITACILAAIAVAAGAFGAHGLKKLVEPQYIDTFKTGAQYQFYHALAIGFATLISQFVDNVWIKRANQAFLIGIILFSGSLYILVASKAFTTEGLGWFGIITPLGGVSFLLGWISLILGIKK
jgi:uncharacterized membrane protein YgdD (TMEM256/DUF423 family)